MRLAEKEVADDRRRAEERAAKAKKEAEEKTLQVEQWEKEHAERVVSIATIQSQINMNLKEIAEAQEAHGNLLSKDRTVQEAALDTLAPGWRTSSLPKPKMGKSANLGAFFSLTGSSSGGNSTSPSSSVEKKQTDAEAKSSRHSTKKSAPFPEELTSALKDLILSSMNSGVERIIKDFKKDHPALTNTQVRLQIATVAVKESRGGGPRRWHLREGTENQAPGGNTRPGASSPGAPKRKSSEHPGSVTSPSKKHALGQAFFLKKNPESPKKRKLQEGSTASASLDAGGKLSKPKAYKTAMELFAVAHAKEVKATAEAEQRTVDNVLQELWDQLPQESKRKFEAQEAAARHMYKRDMKLYRAQVQAQSREEDRTKKAKKSPSSQKKTAGSASFPRPEGSSSIASGGILSHFMNIPKKARTSSEDGSSPRHHSSLAAPLPVSTATPAAAAAAAPKPPNTEAVAVSPATTNTRAEVAAPAAASNLPAAPHSSSLVNQVPVIE